VTVRSFDGKTPRIGEESYVHRSADVFGDVTIGRGCWIGPGARLRGDYGTIVVGDYSSIEDNCVIHARPDETTHIGDWVTIGHGCVIHTATVRDYAVVGMGSIVSDWAVVGVWAVVGEGAVVKQNQEVPNGHIAVGVPARILEKPVPKEYKAQWSEFKKIYVDLARRYPDELQDLE
jgi:carbonic anhydrase/acetyltransferase-like protein (isoleucine patch superfamily)